MALADRHRDGGIPETADAARKIAANTMRNILMIKNFGFAALGMAAVLGATPALAQDASGVRIGAELGILDDDFLGADDISFGLNAGYDFDLGNMIVGPIANYTSTFDDDGDLREVSIGGRIAKKFDGDKQFYGTVSYSNIDADYFPGNLDGVKFGIGFEKDFGGFYGNVETRYGNYEAGAELFQTLIGGGFKF